MASSDLSADPATAAQRLGRLLTATEAKAIADRLADGDTLTAALRAVDTERRAELRGLLRAVCGTDNGPALAVALLRTVQGARSVPTSLDPIWTMPGHVVRGGPLTASAAHLVKHARRSVICSTFNFQRTSALWEALRAVASRPNVAVRVYLDTDAADRRPASDSPTTVEVARHLRPATVLRTAVYDGARVRNHAKFLAVDHRFLLVTSANFSFSAEHGNVEFGVLIDNPNLTEVVEWELRRAEDVFYEQVLPD